MGVRRVRVWARPVLVALAVVLVVTGSSGIAALWPHRAAAHPAGLADLPRPTSGWVQVSAGADHSCGLRADGTAWCWGSNAHGQLGDGTRHTSRVPVQVGPVPAYDPDTELGSDAENTWTQISAGSMNTCAIRSDHTAWCWGANRYGQLGTPEIDGGSEFCGIGGGDQGGCFGPDRVNPHELVERTQGRVLLVSIDTGDNTSCGIGEDSLAWCWGWSELGQGTAEGPELMPIDGVGYYFTQIANAGAHTCAVDPDHRLNCWGTSTFGESGNGHAARTGAGPWPTGTASDWAFVSPGTRFTCGLRSPGSAWCWGFNERGQLGTGTTSPRFLPARVGDATDWAQLESGGSHVCGIRSPGSLWCWGEGRNGQLGIGNTGYRKSPTRVGAGSAWAQVSAGDRHSCAVDVDGVAWCWGNNRSGQLGDGTTTATRWNPTKVRFAQ